MDYFLLFSIAATVLAICMCIASYIYVKSDTRFLLTLIAAIILTSAYALEVYLPIGDDEKLLSKHRWFLAIIWVCIVISSIIQIVGKRNKDSRRLKTHIGRRPINKYLKYKLTFILCFVFVSGSFIPTLRWRRIDDIFNNEYAVLLILGFIFLPITLWVFFSFIGAEKEAKTKRERRKMFAKLDKKLQKGYSSPENSGYTGNEAPQDKH